MKKIVPITCLVVWTITLVLILTFATTISSFIGTVLTDVYRGYVNPTEIVEFDVDIKTQYRPSKYYPLEYTLKTKNNKYASLKFENLTPELLTMNSSGSFTTKKIEEDFAVGKIKVTSPYDLDFEKIIEIPIRKIYPDVMELKTVVASSRKVTKNQMVGIPFYVYPSFTKAISHTEKSVVFTYDEEFFELRDTNCFVPKKEGTTTITATMVSGLTESCTIVVGASPVEVTEFDDVHFVHNKVVWNEEDVIGYKAEQYYPSLKLNGELLTTDFTIKSDNEKVVQIGYTGYVYFREVGDAVVTITLPNGFSKRIPVSVRNRLELPSFSCDKMNEDGVIEIMVREKAEIKYEFPKVPSTQYQYVNLRAKSSGKVSTVRQSNDTIVINAQKLGETTVTLYLDDGFGYVKQEFKVKIVKNPYVIIQHEINVKNFVAKVMGHMALFMIEALIAFWAIHTMHWKRHWFEGLVFVSIGIFVGVITEFIQAFMPNRHPTIKDVGIDMFGYMIGFGFAAVALLIYKKIIKVKHLHEIKSAEHH